MAPSIDKAKSKPTHLRMIYPVGESARLLPLSEHPPLAIPAAPLCPPGAQKCPPCLVTSPGKPLGRSKDLTLGPTPCPVHSKCSITASC